MNHAHTSRGRLVVAAILALTAAACGGQFGKDDILSDGPNGATTETDPSEPGEAAGVSEDGEEVVEDTHDPFRGERLGERREPHHVRVEPHVEGAVAVPAATSAFPGRDGLRVGVAVLRRRPPPPPEPQHPGGERGDERERHEERGQERQTDHNGERDVEDA